MSICSTFISRNQFFFYSNVRRSGYIQRKTGCSRKVMDHKLNIEDLQESLQTSFICKKHDSSEKYRSKFLINSGQFSAGNIQKVICDIIDELRGCESFDISVAFITDGGVKLLTQTLLELKEKGIKGRILTTDYNLFSEPNALKELAELDNIDVRMYRCKEGAGFHVKSFIFNHPSQCNVIVGSSNLTQNSSPIRHSASVVVSEGVRTCTSWI